MKRLVLLFCVIAFLTAIENEDRIKPRAEQDKHPAQNIPRKKYIPEIQHSTTPEPPHSRDTITLIDEDFETGMPADWTVVDGNNDGYTWTTGTYYLLYYHPPNYGTAYAYYSDNTAGSAAPAGTEYLISPSVGCAGATTMTLSYSWGHNWMGGSLYGTSQVRLHDDLSWSNWNTLATYSYTTNGVDTFDLDINLPAESVQVQFTYEDPLGEWGMAFGIDNVLLEAEMPSVYVWDFETGLQDWTHTNGLVFPDGWDVGPSGLYPAQTPPDAGDSTMWIDADAAGSGSWIKDSALSPVCTPNSGIDWLKYGFSNYGGSGSFLNELHVGIKHSTSGVWTATELAFYPSGMITGPEWDSVDVSAYASADFVQVYFYFDDLNTWGYWACFDNASIDATVSGGFHDIGVTRILSPPMGGVPPGDYDWIFRVQNLGDYYETGDILATIWDTVSMTQIFSQGYTLTNFPPGGDTAIDCNTSITIPSYYYCYVYAGIGDDNPANDTLTVNSYVPESLGQHIYSIDAQTPTGSVVLNGVEYDGTYFYLTGATAINETEVFVLDTLGDLIWTIDQPAQCTGYGWHDMAFDRAYIGPDRIDTLYASCDFNVDRFGINKITGALDYYGPLPGPTNPNRPLAYMPESLYFFTADMFYIYKFIKNGSFVFQVTTPWLMSGATYDNDTVGGGSVWWSTADTEAQFRQFNPNTMSFTDMSFARDHPAVGLGFAQNFRDMDVLFSILNMPEADYIYGFFLRWSDSTGVSENIPSHDPEHFGFMYDMPNPIRKNMPISYSLSHKSRVKLSVYNPAGRLLKTLVNGTESTGTHVISWNGKDNAGRKLASGVYFIRLETNQQSDTRKTVFLE
jgi:hypothetical protein